MLSRTFIINCVLVVMILFSIAATYVVMVVRKDFAVVTNEDGLPVLDE